MSYRTAMVMPLRPVEKPPYSIEAPGYKPVEGETIPRRHPKAKDGLLTRPAEDISTAWELIQRSVQKYGDKTAVASRKLVNIHKEMKSATKMVDGQAQQIQKEWTLFELSPYTYLTYKEYETLALEVGSGLRKLGLQAKDRMHIFAATSVQWIAMSHACSSQSLSLVTAYDTLGESGVELSLLQSEASAMFIDPHLLKVAAGPLKKAKSVKSVIYNDTSTLSDPAAADIDAFKAAHPELRVLSFSELRQLGEANRADAVPPSPQDLYCIMYTSGTGGQPKGVPVTHANLVSAVAGVWACVEGTITEKDHILAYLPLAHIMEMTMENLALFLGCTLGYGSPRTLSDASMAKDCPGDMRAFAPTILVGVPQVYETVKKGIIGRVEAAGGLSKRLFWGAVGLKTFLVEHNLPLQNALDGAIFARVRAATGGRLRFTMNGGSGIAEGTQRFLSLVLAPMINGYGLTETCATGALGNPLQWSCTAIGAPPASIDAKLVSLPELGYLATATPPQGEILVRGPCIVAEYYANPAETARAWTADGWFRTGDIGQFDATGHLRVIDRVKNLVKMLGGEYIALEKLEAVYRGGRVVGTGIMVAASEQHARPIAVVSPNEKALADLAAELGVDVHVAHEDKRVRDAVLKDLIAQGKRAGLSSMEMVAAVVIVQDEWTPANGFVTATQKLNRRAVREHWKKEIDQAFASLGE